jgi:spore maturation protein CgeB
MEENIKTEKPLKILIYAEDLAWGAGPLFVAAFRELGHEAELFDWTKYLYTSKGHSLKNRILNRLFFSRVAAKINKSLLVFLANKKFDLILVSKGIHLFPETVSAFAAHTVKTANWNPDDFFNPVNSSGYLREAFTKYDCILTPRRHLIDEYKARGAKRCEYIDWYYVPQFFKPPYSQTDIPLYGNDIVFIGSWSKRREQLINSLKAYRVKVYGGSWKWAASDFKKRVQCLPPIYTTEMCTVMAHSRINLNILTKENRDTSNLRNFEIPACGAFQLAERSKEVLRLFEDGKEIACFSDEAELLKKCSYFLANDKARSEIAWNGYNKVVSGNHTPLDRAREIVEVLFNNEP